MIGHQKQAAEDGPLALLYRKHAQAILSYLDRRVSIKEDAEDLLLEVFLAALENQVWATLADNQQLAWLRRVARNKLVDQYRQKARHPVTPLQELHEALDEDEQSMPESQALRQEAQGMLRRKVAALPKLYQETLRLRFGYGLHTKDIALHLKKTDTAVRIMLSRALNQLRHSYDHEQKEG